MPRLVWRQAVTCGMCGTFTPKVFPVFVKRGTEKLLPRSPAVDNAKDSWTTPIVGWTTPKSGPRDLMEFFFYSSLHFPSFADHGCREEIQYTEVYQTVCQRRAHVML